MQRKKAPRPIKLQNPSREKLQKLFAQLVPQLRAIGFNNLVLVGYRRTSETEKEMVRADEIPDILSDFPDPFQAVALLNWAKEHGEETLIRMAQSQVGKKEEP
jgi:hypothetical protein